jgi:hypothetical protein
VPSFILFLTGIATAIGLMEAQITTGNAAITLTSGKWLNGVRGIIQFQLEKLYLPVNRIGTSLKPFMLLLCRIIGDKHVHEDTQGLIQCHMFGVTKPGLCGQSTSKLLKDLLVHLHITVHVISMAGKELIY